MKAAICTKYGPSEVMVIEDRPKPVPKDNEILIRIHATTVSSGDSRLRSDDKSGIGIYKPIMLLIFGFKRPRQPVFGFDLSGQIEAIGKNVTAYKIGDSVIAVTGMKMGAHAEYIALPGNGKIVQKPDNISHTQAAAMLFGGTTALVFFHKANLQKGSRVLIYGASGAVGTSAVQLASCMGAEVTGVCSGANIELVKSLGANRVIDYTAEDFRDRNEKYDIIFDAVGKITKVSCKNVLAKGGRYVTVNGSPVSERVEDMRLLAELTQNGKYIPVVDKTYPLKQIAEAHAYVETGRKKGNVVIIME